MQTAITTEDVDRAPMGRQQPPKVRLSSGTGEGPTALAAFDAALLDAGVAHQDRPRWAVMSQMRQTRPGKQAHAGVGWVQQDAHEPGLFVELHDDERDRLEHDLQAAVASMRGRNDDSGRVHTAIASRQCTANPVCALVVAVYGGEP